MDGINKMYYSGLNVVDTANGPGVRVSLFVSGCELKCPGCFNPEAQNPKFGKRFTDETFNELIEALRPKHIKGLSLLGGDPLYPNNRYKIATIIKRVKQLYNKDIWLWTGYEIEYLREQAKTDEYLKFILDNVDVIVDGPFIEEKKDLTLQYRGSSNQRVIVNTK